MSKVTVWFERTFAFGYPVELVPNLLSRLRGAPARVEESIRGIRREVLFHKPEGKWSAQEQAGHMLQLEPLWLERVEDFVRGSQGLTPTDLANRATDEAEYNGQPQETIVAAFRAERAKLLHRVAELDAAAWTRSIVHPRMKVPMSLADHLYFVAEHDDHHLARIWEMVD